MADKMKDRTDDEKIELGITNRPLDEEQQEQRELPPRGTRKRDD